MTVPKYGQLYALLNDGRFLIAGSNGGASANLYDPSSGTFTATGNMAGGRDSGTATLLLDGTVLVAGGIGNSGTSQTAEIYDPSTGAFTAANGQMTVPRDHHSAIRLPNGQVLIVGGYNGVNNTYLNSAELYDPNSKTFSAVPNVMTTARYLPGIVLLTNGKVLIVSGSSATAVLTSTEIYDPSTQTFTAAVNLTNPHYLGTTTLLADGSVLVAGGLNTATYAIDNTGERIDATGSTVQSPVTMTTKRYNQSAVKLNDGRVLMIGGQSSSISIASTEAFDPTTNTFTAAGTMSYTRFSAAAVVLQSGNVLVAGGGDSFNNAQSSAELLTPFQATGNLVTARYYATTTVLTNGKVLIAGGQDSSGSILSSAELFDPTTGLYSSTGSMNVARVNHTAALLDDGRVLIAGGVGELSSAETYDPSSGTFTALTATMTAPRRNAVAVVLQDGRVLITGGQSLGATAASTDIFDPTSNTFSAGPTMNAARYTHTATLLADGRVFVAGGNSNGTIVNTTEIFDPAAFAFIASGNLNNARRDHTATLLNNGKVLIAGGDASTGLSSAELFDPTQGLVVYSTNMTIQRSNHAASLLNNGQVLITGGVTQNETATASSAEVFDPVSQTFYAAGTMLSARQLQTQNLLANGSVLITGGVSSFSNNTIPTSEIFAPGTLTPPNLWYVTVTPASYVVPIAGARQYVLTGTFYDYHTEVLQAPLWTSDNPAAITVTNDDGNRGYFYGVAQGTSNIKACAGTVCSGPYTYSAVQPNTDLQVTLYSGPTQTANSTSTTATVIYQVRNNGPYVAKGVQFNATVDTADGVTLSSYDPPNNLGSTPTCNQDGNLYCSLGDIEPGQNILVELNEVFPGPGNYPTTGTGTTSTPETNSTNNSVSLTTAVPVGVSISFAGTGAAAVTSSPAGISCNFACTVYFPVGTQITLTATPRGSVFTGWSGPCTGTSTCTFTLATSGVTATATLSASAPASVVVTPPATSVPPNGSVRFAATVIGTVNGAVTWSVNGITGGNSSVGTISATGLYTAPATAVGSVTITATSTADNTKTGSANLSVTANQVIAKAWGDNSEGQLGIGTSGNAPTTVQITGLSNIIAVSQGIQDALYLRYDGTVWGMGYNSYGELGNGTTTATAIPVQAGSLTGITAISSGPNHTSLALQNDGSVWGWGYNYNGELGNGTTTLALSPIKSSISGVVAVSPGYYATAFLKSDGTVWTSGYNGYGQLGVGSSVYSTATPLQVNISGVVAIAAGWFHILALKNDGTVWAWGYNEYGELGNGTINTSATPIQVPGLPTNIVAVAAGYEYSLALASDGTIWSWGYNGNGELGNGTYTSSTSPAQLTTIAGVTKLFVGTYSSGALKSDGSLWVWGYNAYSELGLGNQTTYNAPVMVPNVTGVAGYSINEYDSIILRNDGLVFGAGSDQYGELGFVTAQHAIAAIQVPGLTGLTSISAGSQFSAAARADGSVWTWGYNNYGQLGDGTNTTRTSPVQVSGLSGVISISAGANHMLALKSDGTVSAWGYNGYGQLGTNNYSSSSTPLSVPITGVMAISAGQYHSLALKNDGTVWAWGYNAEGQLGSDPSSINPSLTPIQVPGLTGVVAISAGILHSLALTSDGTVWAWGYNGRGELGTGNYTQSFTPIPVAGVANVVAIGSEYENSIAVRNDGAVFAWGYNPYGAFGNGTTTSTNVPVATTFSAITQIAPGFYHTLALKSDRTVLSAGYNSDGELGNASEYFTSSYYVTTPGPAVGATSVFAVAAGDSHSLALVDSNLTGLDHFLVTASTQSTKGGVPLNITVTAEDNANNPITNYAGTVHFSLSSPDVNAVLPADYTFTTGDAGTHTFSVTLAAGGPETINAYDTVQTAVIGGTTINVQSTQGADLAVSVAASSGSVVTATVTNNGPAPASNVVLRDVLDRFVILGVTPSQGTCSTSASLVTCNLLNLAAGGSLTVVVTVQPPTGGWASQQFHASADQPDPNPVNNSVYVGPNVDSFNTQTGAGVTVNVSDPADGLGASLTFSSVMRAGATSVGKLSGLPPAPAGYRSVGTPIVFDLSTSASYSGAITITVPFSPSSFRHPALVHLFHLENGAWVDRTRGVVGSAVTAVTTSLSPFALFEPVDTPPVANAGADRMMNGVLTNGATVTLDGSASADTDGDALTYRWSGPFAEGATVSGLRPNVTLPFGTSKVTLVVNDGEVDSPAVTMNVTVTDFGVSTPTSSLSLARGQSGNYTVQVGPKFGAFNAPVSLSCSTNVPGVTCSTAASVTPGTNGAETAVTVNATAMTRSTRPLSLGWLAIMVGPLGLAIGGSRRRTKLLLVLLVLLIVAMAACGGGGMTSSSSSSSTSAVKPGTTVTVTVTGTSGAVQHNSSFTVVVQ